MFPLSPLPDLARHFPKSHSSPLPFSLIQTEAKCINCVSVCIKREKIIYIHVSTCIFVLYTYNSTIKVLPCPVSFAFLSFSFYTIWFNCIFLVKSLLSFSLSHFIQFNLYIIVLYTYNNTNRFINFVFIQFSAQMSFSFLFYTLRFIQFASTVCV